MDDLNWIHVVVWATKEKFWTIFAFFYVDKQHSLNMQICTDRKGANVEDLTFFEY